MQATRKCGRTSVTGNPPTTLTARGVTDPGPVPIRILDVSLLMGGTFPNGDSRRSRQPPRRQGRKYVTGTIHSGLRVKDIAAALGKHPATATGFVMRGVRRRHENPEEVACLEELDKALSRRQDKKDKIHVPGTFLRHVSSLTGPGPLPVET